MRRTPDEWEYELIADRYPIDHSIVFLAKVRLSISRETRPIHDDAAHL